MTKQIDSPPEDRAGHPFFSEQPISLEELVRQQGASPVTDFDSLLGDFWPEDESADDLIAAVRRWRHEEEREGKEL